MDSERTAVTGTVVFRFNYKLTGAEIRPCSYAKANYQPSQLAFTLSAQTYDGSAPSYDDLTVDCVVLRGFKIKQDGTPGKAETNENFYSFSKSRPAWITEIIEQAARELREGVCSSS